MRLVIALLLSATAFSCIGDDDDGDGSNYVLATEIKAAYKEANCTFLTNCGQFPDKASCLASSVSSSASLELDPNIVAAIGAGRVYYNGSNVATCFAALGGRSCDETSESARVTPIACRDILTGTVHGGEACTIDEECISQQCSAGSTGDSCIMGSCIGDVAPVFSQAQLAENCSSNSGCVSGLYCDQITSTCAMLKPQGSSCTIASECAYGLGCVGTAGARTCGALPAVGQSCDVDGVCRDEGTYCKYDSVTGLSTCAQVGLASATCTSSNQCSQYYPCNFSTSQCTKGPALGESCGSAPCFDAGTYCDNTTAMCVGLKSNGAMCNSDTECTSDFCDQSQATPLCASPTVCF
jgi:hypothetical protein